MRLSNISNPQHSPRRSPQTFYLFKGHAFFCLYDCSRIVESPHAVYNCAHLVLCSGESMICSQCRRVTNEKASQTSGLRTNVICSIVTSGFHLQERLIYFKMENDMFKNIGQNFYLSISDISHLLSTNSDKALNYSEILVE